MAQLSKTTVAAFNQRLGTRQKYIGRERDKLDAIISNMEQLRDDCQEAWDCLQDARDALSRTQ